MAWKLRERTVGDDGQASVELLAALPIALLILLCCWQFVLAGHAWWAISESARLAARSAFVSAQVGDSPRTRSRKVTRTARSALPRNLALGARAVLDRDGNVKVSARMPLIAPIAAALGRSHAPTLSASARLAQ